MFYKWFEITQEQLEGLRNGTILISDNKKYSVVGDGYINCAGTNDGIVWGVNILVRRFIHV